MTNGNEGLDHVGFGVSDQAASIAWYGELLGLEQVHEAEWGSMPAMLLGPDTNSGVALFQATDHFASASTTSRSGSRARRSPRPGRGSRRRAGAYDFHDHVAALSLYVKEHRTGITVEADDLRPDRILCAETRKP